MKLENDFHKNMTVTLTTEDFFIQWTHYGTPYASIFQLVLVSSRHVTIGKVWVYAIFSFSTKKKKNDFLKTSSVNRFACRNIGQCHKRPLQCYQVHQVVVCKIYIIKKSNQIYFCKYVENRYDSFALVKPFWLGSENCIWAFWCPFVEWDTISQ